MCSETCADRALARRLFREDRAVAPLCDIVPGARSHRDNTLGLLAMIDRQIAHHKKHRGKEQGFEHKYLYTAAALTERCAR